MSSKNKPAHEVRLGKIRGTVWKNQNENSEGGAFYTVSFSRLYKSDAGEWSNADSFSRDDLPLVMKVADQVHSWLFANAANGNGGEKK